MNCDKRAQKTTCLGYEEQEEDDTLVIVHAGPSASDFNSFLSVLMHTILTRLQ